MKRIFIIIILGVIGMNNMYAQNKDFIFLVEQAIKAPSGHNTQPWKFKIESNRIIIYPNFDRALPVVDSNHRELFISLGCATENLCIAARHMKYLPAVSVSNEGAITVELVKEPTLEDETLFEEITKRQTNRSKYNGKEVADVTLKSIIEKCGTGEASIYSWKKNTAPFDSLKEYVKEGNILQMGDTLFTTELKSWIRFNKRQSEKANDGLSYATFGAPNMPSFISKPIMNSFLNSKKQNNADMAKINSSSHLVLIASKGNTIQGWINTGRCMEHFLLETTKAGIANAYINQPCEIPNLQSEIRSEFPINHEYPMILMRIGYAKPAAYSKRKDVSEVIENYKFIKELNKAMTSE
ncbi:Acg family FMN-binding oxidoreductase [uncultured Bacteroides sp.]|uniref:Acg family FMN-binding oxidoreductase n=1 Tax=uncultured Bacteroides sp. TaxID=162156 RepID=UPI002AAC21F7|nr:nitroreductase [uncultured Bacteroides sp.]